MRTHTIDKRAVEIGSFGLSSAEVSIRMRIRWRRTTRYFTCSRPRPFARGSRQAPRRARVGVSWRSGRTEHASINGDSAGSSDCDLGAIEVPEPGLGVLLASGALRLSGFCLASRRRHSGFVRRGFIRAGRSRGLLSRFQELSNFERLPGRAGGTPHGLEFVQYEPASRGLETVPPTPGGKIRRSDLPQSGKSSQVLSKIVANSEDLDERARATLRAS